MPTVRFCIKNLNREKIVTEITKKCSVKNIKINENFLYFTINKKNIKTVNNLLKEKNAKVLEIKELGIFSFFKKTIFRLGVLIPIILFFIFEFITNNFVFKIKIYGNERVTDSQIYSVLENIKYKKIMPKYAVNTKVIEDAITSLNDISLVSVITYGNTLVINVKEKLYNEEYSDKDSFVPLKSEVDGIITEVTIVQGSTLVKVGDIIKCGQDLVLPTVNDSNSQAISVKPLADIKADVFYNTVIEVPDTKLECVFTGKEQRNVKTMLGYATINDSSNAPTFEHFTSEVRQNYLCENNLLPIMVIETIYKEYYYVEIENYFIDNKDKILEEVKQITRQKVRTYDIIKDEYFVISSNAGINRISYTVVANGSAL